MEPNIGLLDSLPLWSLFPMAVVIAGISVELGYYIARYRLKKNTGEPEAPPTGMVGPTLGLLAFMLAFTFGLASTRYEARRQLVLEESNAIGTAYLRASLLPEPFRGDAQSLLKNYVDVRLEGSDPGKVVEAVKKSEDIQGRLWSNAAAFAEKERTAITSLFLTSLTTVAEVHAKRMTIAIWSRVPSAIWVVLYTLLVLGMAAVGYQSGMASKKRSVATVMLILGFSSVLYLIADLDRPGRGWLQTSQQSMLELQRRMNK